VDRQLVAAVTPARPTSPCPSPTAAQVNPALATAAPTSITLLRAKCFVLSSTASGTPARSPAQKSTSPAKINDENAASWSDVTVTTRRSALWFVTTSSVVTLATPMDSKSPLATTGRASISVPDARWAAMVRTRLSDMPSSRK
jgi:hypothetical protein